MSAAFSWFKIVSITDELYKSNLEFYLSCKNNNSVPKADLRPTVIGDSALNRPCVVKLIASLLAVKLCFG